MLATLLLQSKVTAVSTSGAGTPTVVNVSASGVTVATAPFVASAAAVASAVTSALASAAAV